MITNWLKKRKHLLSILQLEKESGIPTDTLQKYLQGKQGFPDKWQKELEKFVVKNLNYNKPKKK